MTIETVEDALKHLNKRKGWRIEKINKNLYHDRYNDGEPIIYNARQLIKLAKVFSSENKQETTINKNVKHFSNGKNRTHTRDAIQTEDFDKIPNINSPVAEEDRWGWD